MPNPNPNEFALLKSTLGPSAPCPDLATLSGGDQDPDLQRHLAGCSHCRTELAMLREFEAAEPRTEELANVQWIQSELRRRAPELVKPAASYAPRPESIWDKLRVWAGELFSPEALRPLSVAAASLLVVVAAGMYLRHNGETPSIENHPAVWRSGQFAAVAPIGDITQTPTEFRWESVPNATEYTIQVTEVDGAVVWSATSGQITIEIPQNIRRVLRPGRAFQWEVVARNAAGERIGSTGLQIIHILATSR